MAVITYSYQSQSNILTGHVIRTTLIRNEKKGVDFIRTLILSGKDYINVYVNAADDQTALHALYTRIAAARQERRYMLVERCPEIEVTDAFDRNGNPILYPDGTQKSNRSIYVRVRDIDLILYNKSAKPVEPVAQAA